MWVKAPPQKKALAPSGCFSSRDSSTNSLQLTQVERHKQLMKWDSTKTEYPQTCIHKLVEAVVELLPDAVAVVFEQESLTYRQLNSRANILSHYLQVLGVEKEVLVGICMERSLEMLVGILSLLKVGGAYMLLVPAYPIERLALMLEDTQTKVPRNPDYVRCRNTPQTDNQPRARTFARLIEPAICAQIASRLKRGIARLDTQPNIKAC